MKFQFQPFFFFSILMSFVAFGLVTKLYIAPRLRRLERHEALRALVMPHAFRFIGLSFMVPGVVSPSLPPDFAAPGAYGDLTSAVLAVMAAVALSRRAPASIPLTWLFNLVGTADLLFAFYQGLFGVPFDAGLLGAAFFISTALVPAFFILHGYIFRLLVRPEGKGVLQLRATPPTVAGGRV